MSEMLKINTTLTSLALWGDEEGRMKREKKEMMNDWQTIGLELKEQNQ